MTSTPTIYRGTVKLVEQTLFTVTDEDLERLLVAVNTWREDANHHQLYDLYITDQWNRLLLGSSL